MKKTDLVKMSLKNGDYKVALRTAKDFRLGISKEQREHMTRAYECIVHPEFYRQIGVDIPAAIEKGKAIVIALYEETEMELN